MLGSYSSSFSIELRTYNVLAIKIAAGVCVCVCVCVCQHYNKSVMEWIRGRWNDGDGDGGEKRRRSLVVTKAVGKARQNKEANKLASWQSQSLLTVSVVVVVVVVVFVSSQREAIHPSSE